MKYLVGISVQVLGRVLATFGLVDGEGAREVFVDDGGHVARVVREHDAVGADVLRARAARARRAAARGPRAPATAAAAAAALAFRLGGTAACSTENPTCISTETLNNNRTRILCTASILVVTYHQRYAASERRGPLPWPAGARGGRGARAAASPATARPTTPSPS